MTHWESVITDVVRNASDGTALFPPSITVDSVVPSLTCVTGDYRMQQTPIVTVTAQLTITYPFGQLFQFVGVALPTVQTSISDSSRIFGA